MIKEADKTDWYKPSQKPVRIGVYENRNSCLSYWDGKEWRFTVGGFSKEAVESAYRSRHRPSIMSQDRQWRGLTKEQQNG